MVWISKQSRVISILSPTVVYLTIFFLGWLRFAEYNLYDFYLKSRSLKSSDSRIVIVGITEEDLNKLGQTTLDDGTLVKVLKKIKTKQPRVIGLDMHRNLPTCFVADSCQADYRELGTLFRNTPNLIGVEKTDRGHPKEEVILPHPELAKAGRTGDAAIIEDGERKVRRSYFYTTNLEGENIYGFGAKVALEYLKTENIKLDFDERIKTLKLNDVVIPKIKAQEYNDRFLSFLFAQLRDFNRHFFYFPDEVGGYQFLLNYHSNFYAFKQLSISQILDNNFTDEELRDKIVLIGSVSQLGKDIYYIPQLSWEKNPRGWTYGVEIHAQSTSYLINLAFGERSNIKFIPLSLGLILIFFFLLEPLVIIYLLDKTRKKTITLIVLAFLQTLIILLASWGTFSLGYWMPGANFMAITALTIVTLGVFIYQYRQEQEKLILSEEVKSKTLELEKALSQLERITQELVQEQKLDFFLETTAFLDHEIKNPLGVILSFTGATEAQSNLLLEYVEDDDVGDNIEEIKEIVTNIINNNVAIAKDIKRINDLLILIDTQSYQREEDLFKINIYDLLEQVIKLSLYTFKKKVDIDTDFEVKIVRDFAKNIEECYLYPKSLSIALYNIIKNGLYSLSQKKKKLDSFKPKIKIQVKKQQNYLVINIEDNGEGIDSKNLPKIFREFYSTKQKSLGLGLFITRQIIESQHQGTIEVTSKKDSYARFTIKIPIDLTPK